MCCQQLKSEMEIADLANFDFEIIYKPGTLNSDADGLSWIPDSNQITSESIKAICNSTNISPCVPLELNTFDDFHLFCDGLVDMQI